VSETSAPHALAALAAASPDALAIRDVHGDLTRAELVAQAARLAQHLLENGVTEGDLVTMALPSDRSMLLAAIACWWIGATPNPVSPKMPPTELEATVDVAKPALVLTSLPDVTDGKEAPLTDVVSRSWKAPVSGGSTGRPKVIVAATPAVVEQVTAMAPIIRISADDVTLITAPLNHNAPFLFSSITLLLGGSVVLAGRFDAEMTLQLIRDNAITWLYVVPTMMSRISKLETRGSYDVSSVRTAFHMAAPCPVWVKRDWIEWLGPDAVWELYAGTEAQAVTFISGAEWLEHPGSVGRCLVGEMEIRDPSGAVLPAGEVGEVWMRNQEQTYTYLGAEAKTADGGWESLGDLGSFDADGYLYLSDRLADMVLVGGANVYPAEVEAVLDEHPQVLSSVVIGLPDDDLGNRLHALVQLGADLSDDDLRAWCRERLSPYKVPKTWERSDVPLRDEAAKVRRSQLRTERSSS
jgi:bile acid-coenzyme A ligase